MVIKNIIRKVKRYLFDSNYRFLINANIFHKYDAMQDNEYLERKYEATMGKQLELTHPKRFNEKVQWLKLYNRNPEYITMVDKYKVKDYVAGIIGDEYIIPTLGVWDNPDEIDFDALPNQFVLKCNHNSGLGMYICRDKSKMDIRRVKRDLRKGLRQDYYLPGREWPYKDVKRKIIAEKYISNGEEGLTDYKVHNFNGVPKFILVCKDRFKSSGLTEDFFSITWEHLDVKRPKNSYSSEPITQPEELKEILKLSAKLSKNIPFVRADFYIVNHHVYFSELTFFPASGFEPYEPEEWDYIFGNYLKLPNE